MKKILVLGVVLLFLGVVIGPTHYISEAKTESSMGNEETPKEIYWYDLELNYIYVIYGDLPFERPRAIGVKYTNVGDTPVKDVTVSIWMQNIITRKFYLNTFGTDNAQIGPNESSTLEVASLPIKYPLGLYKITCRVYYSPGRDMHPLNNFLVRRGWNGILFGFMLFEMLGYLWGIPRPQEGICIF